jgi:RNA polymerase sigma-70 factor (ECF subfamily)
MNATDEKTMKTGGAHCNDGDLTERAREGDLGVFEDMIKCYSERLLAFSRDRCGDEEDARDTVQDALVAAYRYLPGFRGETTLKSWLFRLVASACIKRRRGMKHDRKRHQSMDAEDSPQHAGNEPDPERRASMVELVSVVSEALRDLSELDRAVLLMRDSEEMSAKEVADALRLTVPAVKSRLHRARTIVRTRIEETRAMAVGED